MTSVELDEAKLLSEQHIAGHDRPRDEYLPECMRCHQYMESGPDYEPTAFCDACAFHALDLAAPAVLELDAWRNCFVCPKCGRGKADEDGCCTTCGRDCIGFIDGRLVHPLPEVPDPQLVEDRTAKAIATWLLDTRFVKRGREAEWSRFLAAQIIAGKWRP